MASALSPKAFDTLIVEVAGEDVLPLVHVLKKKDNVDEFKLASTIKQEINTTRNMLYRLYNKNLVTFNRKKDKKKGWYIYYWTFNKNNVAHLVREMRLKRLHKLEDRLANEQNNVFYRCVNRCVRLSFEEATNYFYKCPECGELLNQENNTKRVEVIAQTIKEIKDQIAEEEKDRQVFLKKHRLAYKKEMQKEAEKAKKKAKKKATKKTTRKTTQRKTTKKTRATTREARVKKKVTRKHTRKKSVKTSHKKASAPSSRRKTKKRTQKRSTTAKKKTKKKTTQKTTRKTTQRKTAKKKRRR